jgi:hypothetical protein
MSVSLEFTETLFCVRWDEKLTRLGSELSNSVLTLLRLQNDFMEGWYVINEYVARIDSLIWKYILECSHICLVESIVIK